MYAILDIETTGGQFNEEGITEIAIYKFDGHEIVDQFISLINLEYCNGIVQLRIMIGIMDMKEK